MLRDSYECRRHGEVCDPNKRMCCDGSTCTTTRIDAQNVVHHCEFEKQNLSLGAPCARTTDCQSGFCRKPDESTTLRLFGASSETLRGTCAALPQVSLPDDFKRVSDAPSSG